MTQENQDYIQNLETIKNVTANLIKKLTENYDGSQESYHKLENLYNRLYQVCDILTKQKGSFQGGIIGTAPCILTVDAKPKFHVIDHNLLDSLSKGKSFYTLEEAEALVKWTVNNTRQNLTIEGYDEDLTGCCGLSQFISLYPLQKLGLKVTINNAADFCDQKLRHAFGTVTIPVLINQEIVQQQYLIDCTYSQFYMLHRCVENVYSESGRIPDAGYFVKGDEEKESFVKELLTNGYTVFNEENIRKYAYGLYMSTFSREEFLKGLAEFEKIDLVNIINTMVEEYDYDEDELVEAGYNLEIMEDHFQKK